MNAAEIVIVVLTVVAVVLAWRHRGSLSGPSGAPDGIGPLGIGTTDAGAQHHHGAGHHGGFDVGGGDFGGGGHGGHHGG